VKKPSTRAWQRMLSGRRLDLIEPSPLDVEIEDIAHGLSRVARWNGQTRGDEIFSVAQHSLLVEALFGATDTAASATDRLVALLHDAPEYVVGDMISPFKATIGDHYRAVEERLLTAVHLRYAMPARVAPPLKKAIKTADRLAAYFEATQLAGFAEQEAVAFFGPPKIALTEIAAYLAPLRPVEAQRRFLARFFALEAQRTAPDV
jgi:5'-deoxynucleotidase YfbR-like HD superfamily hydrolase